MHFNLVSSGVYADNKYTFSILDIGEKIWAECKVLITEQWQRTAGKTKSGKNAKQTKTCPETETNIYAFM